MSRSTNLAMTALWLIPWSAQPCGAQEPTRALELIERFDANGDQMLDTSELSRALEPQQQDELQFIRVGRNADGEPESLETAVATFRSPDRRQQVDLIGAIHVGDRSYYKALNRRFRDYDVVLYELIAPEGTRVPKGGQPSDHPVSRVQRAIRSMLDLSFQLEEIDYTAKHLVHADMSPKEFASSMEERGESFLQILYRILGQAASQSDRSGAPSDGDILKALFSPDRPLRLKRILAGQFENLEGQLSMIEGPNGSTILSERNKRALEVLRRQQALGHNKIAIFYGTLHMDDMAKRLQQDDGLKYDSTQWVRAWDMSDESQ